MGKFFVKTNQIDNNAINITGDDVNHIKNVLRLNVGDRIDICNSESRRKCRITYFSRTAKVRQNGISNTKRYRIRSFWIYTS